MTKHSFQSLQYFRGLAAILVVFSHAQIMIPGFPRVVPYFFGNAGVYIFFAISGFLMIYVTERRRYSIREFLQARITRVVPLYWICTTGVFFLLTFLPQLGRGTEVSWGHYLLSLAFVPHATEAEPNDILPMLKVGWTLIYEMFFYALFALGMAISYKRRFILVSMTLLTLAFLFGLFGTTRDNFFLLSVYGDPIIIQFAIGMFVATIFVRVASVGQSPNRKVISIAVPAIFFASTIWMVFFDTLDIKGDSYMRLVAYGLPSAAIISAALMYDMLAFRISKILFLLGEASYSIYLIHMLPMAVFRQIWTQFELPSSGYFFAVVFVFMATAISVVVGVVLYVLVESKLVGLWLPRSTKINMGSMRRDQVKE